MTDKDNAWKLVPIEPTKEMWMAVNKLDDQMAAGSYDGKGCSIEQAWACLVDAAPVAPAPAETWQPIETAPKDGTAVLVVLPDSDIPCAARFDAGCNDWRHCWDNYRLRNLDAPTHWMPLPPALSAQRAASTAAIAADGAGNSDRAQVVARAVAAHNRAWPEQLTSGVMFYEGERITKAEFLSEVRA